MKDIFQQMADRWTSSVVARTQIEKFTGGALTSRYLANLDCDGKGIQGRFTIGRKVVYPTDSVIQFLKERSA